MQSCTPSNLLSGLHPYEENNPNTVVIDRLDLYYTLNPDRIPDAVFVGDGYDDVMNWYIDQFGYTVTDEGEYGTILTRI